MAEIRQSERAARILQIAWEYRQKDRNEFVTPEHLLLAMMRHEVFAHTLSDFCRPDKMCDSLFRQMREVETVPEGQDYEPETSAQLGEVINYACQQDKPGQCNFCKMIAKALAPYCFRKASMLC